MMNVTADTKVGDILKAYPWLKDELIKMDDRLKILNTPMANIVIKKATVKDASDKIGMSVEEIIEKLEKMVAAHEG